MPGSAASRPPWGCRPRHSLQAFVSGVAVYVLAYRRGLDSYRLVLAGLGISGLAASLTTWILTLGDVTSAAQALTWMTGSLNGKDWTTVQPMAVQRRVAHRAPLSSAAGGCC